MCWGHCMGGPKLIYPYFWLFLFLLTHFLCIYTQGLCTDGVWGCFDDLHTLSGGAISIITEISSTIITALKTKVSKLQRFEFPCEFQIFFCYSIGCTFLIRKVFSTYSFCRDCFIRYISDSEFILTHSRKCLINVLTIYFFLSKNKRSSVALVVMDKQWKWMMMLHYFLLTTHLSCHHNLMVYPPHYGTSCYLTCKLKNVSD